MASPSPPEDPDTPSPEGPNPPPPPKPVKLPKPDGFGDINRSSLHSREKEKAEKKRGRKKSPERRHPKDAYEKVRNKRGGCGPLFLLLLVFVLCLGGGLTIWFQRVKTDLVEAKGFAWVVSKESVISEAPAEKTAYFSARASYEAPETRTEIAFMGGNWWLSGTFHEKVTFRGAQLTLEPRTRFLKGLDVQAVKLDLNNAEIAGELTGKILQQTNGE